MIKVMLAKNTGFCPGVKRAWNLVEKISQNKPDSAYILGELIHNKQAIEQLSKYGVKIVNKPEEIEGKGVVVIRAHGEPPQTYRKLKKLKLKIIDATCPLVARVQKLAKKLEEEGYLVVVCGEKDHPETKATVGYTKNGMTLGSVEEARKVPFSEKIGAVSQTTFSPAIFEQICRVLKNKASSFKSLGTICNFTQLAQKEARELALKVDLMIVVGGKQSLNTKRLLGATRKIVPTRHIETVTEVEKEWLVGVKKVGLLAGASTPDWVTKRVKKRLEEL